MVISILERRPFSDSGQCVPIGTEVSAENAVNSPGVVNIEDLKFIAPNLLMGIYSPVYVVLIAVGVFFQAWTGLRAIFPTSLFMSLMFLTIFALGLKGLGAMARNNFRLSP